jgi:Cys-rich protein (TIGR01571 family)
VIGSFLLHFRILPSALTNLHRTVASLALRTVHAPVLFLTPFQVNERGNTRQRYKIAGNQCGDCMASWCCLPCVLTQESLEIEGEERSFAEAEQTEGMRRDLSQAQTREREGTLPGQRQGRPRTRSKK